MKKLKFLALPFALIAMLGFVACSSDDDSSSGSTGDNNSENSTTTYTTSDLVGTWTTNATVPGFAGMVLYFTSTSKVTVYGGTEDPTYTDYSPYTVSGNLVTISGFPDEIKSIILTSKKKLTMTYIGTECLGIPFVADFTKTSTSTSIPSQSSETTETSKPTTYSEYVAASHKTIDDIVAGIKALTADGTVKVSGYLLEKIGLGDLNNLNYDYVESGYYNSNNWGQFFLGGSIYDALSDCKNNVTLDLSDVEIVPVDEDSKKLLSDKKEIWFPWDEDKRGDNYSPSENFVSALGKDTLAGIYFPKNVTNTTWDSYYNPKDVKFPSTLTTLEGDFNTEIESLTIPASVTRIGASFYNADKLTSVTFEDTTGWKLEYSITQWDSETYTYKTLASTTRDLPSGTDLSDSTKAAEFLKNHGGTYIYVLKDDNGDYEFLDEKPDSGNYTSVYQSALVKE